MVFMLVACGEEHDFTNALKHAQCLVNENPEQAQAILDSLRPQLSAQSELWQKRYELEYARTKNKLQPTFCEVEQMKKGDQHRNCPCCISVRASVCRFRQCPDGNTLLQGGYQRY